MVMKVALKVETSATKKDAANPAPKAAPKGKIAVPIATDTKRTGSSNDGGDFSGVLFKSDGTPVKNPARYIEGIKKNGYSDPLMDAKGQPIRDPVAYVEKMMANASGSRGTKRTGPSNDGGDFSGVLFKSDGTPVQNPARYIEGIKKNGYSDPLMDANGKQIRDPVAYVEKMIANASGSGGTKRTWSSNEGGDFSGVLFKSDGTPVQNPARYIEGIKKNGYSDPLMDANGQPIRDPVAYVEKMMANASGSLGAKRSRTSNDAGDFSGVLFKSDGTPVQNPARYIEGIKKNGYSDPLMDAKGQPIRDPVAYVEKMMANASGSLGAKRSTSWNDGGDFSGVLFKSDGTPVQNPARYIEGIKKNGYSDPLMDASGKQIRDPVAYVEKMMSNASGSRGASGAAAGGGQIYKQDGTPIKNPQAFVAGIEKNGYTEPLFDANGQHIRNPVAYVNAMKW